MSSTERWWCATRSLWTRRLRLYWLLILLRHVEVVDSVLMLWLLYALSAWLSIIDGLLSRCLLSSCHIVEAYAQAATTIGAGDDFLLHTLWVVDLQALLALWAGDEFLLYYHWIIFGRLGNWSFGRLGN